MTTRQQIIENIKEKRQQIGTLYEEINQLYRESLLLSDDEQWFTEKEETEEIKVGRKKEKRTFLAGRIHWNETFKDADTGQEIVIERSRLVRVNGEWVNNF